MAVKSFAILLASNMQCSMRLSSSRIAELANHNESGKLFPFLFLMTQELHDCFFFQRKTKHMLAFELGEKLSPRCCAAARKAFFSLPTTESLLHTPWTIKLVHLSFTPFSFHPLLKTLGALSMLPISTPITSRHVVSYPRCAVLGKRKTFDSISSVSRPSQ